MSFLTVEDVNTVNLNYINEFYKIDTSKISSQEFNNILYDFCIVSHSTNNNEHIFTFEVHNKLWCGYCRVLNAHGSTLDDVTYSNGVITVVSDTDSVKLILYLCSYVDFNFNKTVSEIPNINFLTINKNEMDSYKDIPTINHAGETSVVSILFDSLGVNTVLGGFLLILLKKTDLTYDLSDTTLQVGIVNTIQLNIDGDYLPGGCLVDNDLLDIVIEYEGLKIPAYYDEDLIDYCFDLDLTEKIDDAAINIKIVINENDLVNAGAFEHKLSCNYASAATFADLQSQMVSGAEIIELTDNITFTNNLIIPNDVYIIGNELSIDLSNYNIKTQSNNVKCENINFNNGSSCFIQDENSKLILNNCKFNNAFINDIYKGSVISSNVESTITELKNCVFNNCHHTIYTGGELTVNNCKALFNVWNDSVDNDYSAFATVYDGNVEITNSIFDIDYDTDILCSNEIDIKFSQSLIALGEDTVFNGANSVEIKNSGVLPLFNAPYNNVSHLFAKYYYPQIENCVVSSPVSGSEDKSVCYTFLGDDWVYKNNVQVTRSSWNSENNIRKIIWED